MGRSTGIEWTDRTFNPWIGCTKVSAGCANCYAEQLMDHRWKRVKWGKGAPRQRTSVSNWNDPIKWNREAEEMGVRFKVFCASLADVFDAEVPAEWRRDLFSLIAKTPNLDWLILTKRPENFARWLPRDYDTPPWPWPNVWLGVSVEDQETAEERIPILLETPAALRWISYEPALGPIEWHIDWFPYIDGDDAEVYSGIDWIIVGGESAQSIPARPFDMDWARSTIRAAASGGAKVFVKQMGSNPVGDCDCEGFSKPFVPHRLEAHGDGTPFVDQKGKDPHEWPADLRVRQFPTVQS